jgi:hypothetical protein
MSWRGLDLAEQQIRTDAAAAGGRSNVTRYRATLQRRYRAISTSNGAGEIKKFSQGDTE